MNRWLPLLLLLLLMFAPGCIPFAYIAPDVDVYHANLASLATPADESVVAFKLLEERHTQILQSRAITSIDVIPLEGATLTRVYAGHDRGYGYFSVLGQEVHDSFDTRVKIYRRGHKAKSLASGVRFTMPPWELCGALVERELAIDSLTSISRPEKPKDAAAFPTEEEFINQQIAALMKFGACDFPRMSKQVVAVLVQEYEFLAELASDASNISNEQAADVRRRCLEKAAKLRLIVTENSSG